MNQVTAYAKNIRISPQKVSLVTREIKKMKPHEAVKILDFVPNKSSKIVKKVLLSAMANAKNNFGAKDESLFIDKIIVSKGPMFKRYRAVARGRAHPILKRTAHIKVVLGSDAKVEQKEQKATEVTQDIKTKTKIKESK